MTMWVKHSGTWKIPIVWAREAGVWSFAKTLAKHVGQWKLVQDKLTLSAGGGGTISVTDIGSPFSSLVAIRFHPDGRVERGTQVQGGSLTWIELDPWITPQSEAGSVDCSVRYKDRAGSYDFDIKAAAENSYVDIDVIRTWTMTRSGPGTSSFTCNFQVRDNLSVLASAVNGYTFRIDNDSGF